MYIYIYICKIICKLYEQVILHSYLKLPDVLFSFQTCSETPIMSPMKSQRGQGFHWNLGQICWYVRMLQKNICKLWIPESSMTAHPTYQFQHQSSNSDEFWAQVVGTGRNLTALGVHTRCVACFFCSPAISWQRLARPVRNPTCAEQLQPWSWMKISPWKCCKWKQQRTQLSRKRTGSTCVATSLGLRSDH